MSVLLSSLLYRLSSIVPTSDLFSFSSPGLCVSILCWFQPTWISLSGVTAHPPSPLVPLISFLSHSESAFGGCRNCSVGYRGGSWFQLQENSESVGLRSQNVRAGSSSLESGAPRQETAAFFSASRGNWNARAQVGVPTSHQKRASYPQSSKVGISHRIDLVPHGLLKTQRQGGMTLRPCYYCCFSRL